MTCLGKECEFLFYAHFVLIRKVNGFDAAYDFIRVLLDVLLGSQVALVVEFWIGHVAYILHQVLPQAVCQSLDVIALP